jgi:predicted nucleotidyltransferase
MELSDQLPGTAQHQQILQVMRDFYGRDNRVLAVIVFGSLARGNWHERSDLDLDVVIDDNAYFDAGYELNRLCTLLQDKLGLGAIRIFRSPDAGDVVLSNLVEFSVRYHHLSQTSPNIVDAMWQLTGELPLEVVQAAGLSAASRVPQLPLAEALVDECVRYTLETANAIERGHLWLAVELLHRIRDLLMQVFALCRGGLRPLHHFQQAADSDLQARVARLLPQLNHDSLSTALHEVVNILQHELPRFTSIDVLNDVQREILVKIADRIDTDPQPLPRRDEAF